MNLKNNFHNKKEVRFRPGDLTAIQQAGETILNWLPDGSYQPVVICIGTDRSTGDCLGPLTGTLLQEQQLSKITVYGTLEEPIHAVNLEEKLREINAIHVKPFVIAVDACLGKAKSVGSIIAAQGPVKPGAALKKPLPEVGDIHLSGVVNISGFMEFSVLQNTRLQVVMKIARQISETLVQLDKHFAHQQAPSVLHKFKALR